MKKCFIILSLAIASLKGNAQNSSPFTFRTEITGDLISNMHGGRKSGHSYVGKIDLSLGLSTEKAGWFKGGKLFLHAINAHGGNPSARYVGDIQPVSRIEATNRISLFEFWYRQDIGKFSVLFGQFDMNSTFAVNATAGNFLNTSFGMYPSIALNVPLSIYPYATPSLYAKWKQSEKLAFQAAVFDGSPLKFQDNPNNLKWQIDGKKRLFSTFEIQMKEIKDSVVKGNYKIGGYYHNGDFRNLSDSSNSVDGSYGIYVTMDRLIIAENSKDNQGVTAFLQSGSSPGKTNLVDFYLSTGLIYTGILPSRSNDILGLGFVYSSINNHLHQVYPISYTQSRCLIELNYKAQFGNNFIVQPDFQYIINPGANPAFKNSLVGILRVSLVY